MSTPATLWYISENIQGASDYRRVNRYAQGMGYASVIDALSDLAKRRAASSSLLAAAKALATGYLKAQRDDASLCINAAHHKAVCDLFAEIERESKGGAQ